MAKSFPVIAVIGAGPAGLAAAKTAARLGARVALIDPEPPGGRALWHSLVPSKCWLAAAEALEQVQRADELGIDVQEFEIDVAKILNNIQTAQIWQMQQDSRELQKIGVEVVPGLARFVGERRLLVTPENEESFELKVDGAIVATGSIPIFPSELKPDGKRIIAPRFLGKLERLPKKIAVIGAGVSGCEVAWLFNRLGCRVKVFSDLPYLLPHIDPQVSAALEHTLADQGVAFAKEQPVVRLSSDNRRVTLSCLDGSMEFVDMAFVAIGRRADLAQLDLDVLDGQLVDAQQALAVDEFACTALPWLFAAGDATGAPMHANRASVQGRVAAHNLVLGCKEVFHSEWIVEAVYTEPQVAQVGLTLKHANQQGIEVEAREVEYSSILKTVVNRQQEGWLRLFLEPHSQKVLGATAIGAHAADLMTTVAMALRAGLSVNALSQVAAANPTISELLGRFE
ncbi:NAD(P)/FAD-dependent oxidoreductase [candidate division KSB1 bacterium]|nr:NAD(P)/FAD-dependent oxidoreductase [candidate division KSB1 bacterium]